MKKILTLTMILGIASFTYAQTEADALRFSRTANYGTARSAAMGGAFGALGGDISTLSTNPAGIGVFRKHEISFTPLINFTNTKSGEHSAADNSFQIGTLGGVFSFYNPNANWKSFNFGINYTNLNNFNRKTNQAVANWGNSLTDVWSLQANGYAPGELDIYGNGLAFNTYLIDTAGGYNYHSALRDGELVNQYKTIKEDGYQGEYAISFGTNYKDKLYLGATIGIQSVLYKMSSTYSEVAPLDADLDFFNFNEYLKISGAGVNLKFGAIYRPIPELRLGVAVHTPTWYSMSQSIENSLYAQYQYTDPNIGRDQLSYEASSADDGEYYYGPYRFDYDLKTPWRAILSVATVLKQKAIISVDYEYVDYGAAKYSDPSDGYPDYPIINRNISEIYQGGHNLRAGAEYRFNSLFSLRGGYSYQGSPYKYAKKFDKIQSASGGFGLNFGQFYCDAAYTYRFAKNDTRFYDLDGVSADLISNKYINNEARITLGVKF